MINKQFHIVLILMMMSTHGSSQNYVDTIRPVRIANIFFESGESVLDTFFHPQIDSLLLAGSLFDSSSIFVIGHSDEIGSHEYNLDLSRRRAHAIVKYLKMQDYDSTRIFARFHGEEVPKANNNSEAGRAINRRVEVVLRAHQRLIYVRGQVKSNSSHQPSQIKLSTNNYSNSAYSDSLGHWVLKAPIKRNPLLEIHTPGFLPIIKILPITPDVVGNIIRDSLEPIAVGKNFRLVSLHFHGNQSLPLPGSRKVVRSLGQFLKQNPTVCVEIQGHINKPNAPPVAVPSESFQLSIARAKVVHDYLLLFHAIPTDRVYYRGYGNARMLHPKAQSEEYQAKNRRVEVHICSCAETSTAQNPSLLARYSFYNLKNKKDVFW